MVTRIHKTAVIEDRAVIGAASSVWDHVHVRTGARVGSGVTLGRNVFVDAGVHIGDRSKIQNHALIYAGVTIEEEVFVGPGVVFTNDLHPRAVSPDWEIVNTRVRRGASIGANATVVCGVTIGEYAMVGAGSVVTKDVSAHALFVGNPARQIGWVCRKGHRLETVPTPDVECLKCSAAEVE